VESVDLVGHPHCAQLCRHRRTGAAGDHEPRQNRPQFAGDRQHDNAGDGGFRVEAGEPGVGLQRQHHAGEQRRQRHHGKGEKANFHEAAADQPRVEWRANDVG
jgi:hypothetical protein